ncbi:MAG: NAD(P)-dependent alcohol dehydrogenase [Rhodospirillales bacterium]|nr:NAD(P)-dependent alcohol dehydrogenase [Alphaproteobacteria bacterium]MBL6948247.1 NAD(P)-dependent alcohol dehydrogenase [Rhodospirillales bacterium]
MKAWEITSAGGIDALELKQRPTPQPGHNQVLVRVGASSINYRDLSTIRDPEARKLAYPTIPNSDCAGVVTAIGDGVTNIAVGDRVMGCFFQDWETGGVSPKAMASALGGPIDGVLAEEVVLNTAAVVPVPEHLSLEEASTLPCAALTAWHALTADVPVEAGETVLLLGTGGVSVFAQQFCAMLGVQTIVTSSSDDKLAHIRELGAAQTINYKTDPDWEKTVLDMTDGLGVDRVVEVGGPGTLQKSITAVRVGGRIQLIGVLTDPGAKIAPVDIMRKSITVKGIYVAPAEMFRAMAAAIEEHRLHPVIDQVFDFEQARGAYHAMAEAGHFGKIVIRVE